MQIAKGKRSIHLGAVHPSRDFTFVSDTVAGFIKAMDSDVCGGELINLGSNFEISIGDTVEAIAEVMGTKIEIITDRQRLRPNKSEVDRLWSDNSKAKSLLGWKPKYGGIKGFKRGLKETASWFMSPENLNGYKSEQYNV